MSPWSPSATACAIARARSAASSGSNRRPTASVGDDVDAAARARGDDRRPGGQRLEQDEPERLVDRGQHGRGRGPVGAGELRGRARVGDLDPGRERRRPVAGERVGAAGEHQPGIREPLAQERERLQQQPTPLARIAERRRAEQRRGRRSLDRARPVGGDDAARQQLGLGERVAAQRFGRGDAEGGHRRGAVGRGAEVLEPLATADQVGAVDDPVHREHVGRPAGAPREPRAPGVGRVQRVGEVVVTASEPEHGRRDRAGVLVVPAHPGERRHPARAHDPDPVLDRDRPPAEVGREQAHLVAARGERDAEVVGEALGAAAHLRPIGRVQDRDPHQSTATRLRIADGSRAAISAPSSAANTGSVATPRASRRGWGWRQLSRAPR